MIELLGIGVAEHGTWRLRRVCARFERRTLAAVLSERRDERLHLLDVIAGRTVPSEGRAWFNGTPLRDDTAPRIRQRVGVVDLVAPLKLDRTATANVGVPDRQGLLGRFTTRSRRPSSRAVVPPLARVGLAAEALVLASELSPWDRVRLAVARALRGHPDHLVIAEPDACLAPGDALRLLHFLRVLVSRDGVSAFVSLADPGLAQEADIVLRVAATEVVLA